MDSSRTTPGRTPRRHHQPSPPCAPGAGDPRAHTALQAVIDALATARGVDEIVPTVLAIAARTFGVASAAYFEHGGADGETVFLRYWLYEDRVLRPDELLAVDPTAPRQWIDGFRPPVGAPGGPRPSANTRAVVIDHTHDTADPEVDAWCRAHGWPLVLRVPCLVGGVARGGLVLCRAATSPYTAAEIALAKALAKQLALAVEADRLTHDVRERAAHARAAEIARTSAALQTVTDALAVARGFDEIVPAVLRIAARTFDAGAVAFFERTGPEGRAVVVRYWLIDDRLLRPAELAAVDPLMPRLWLGPFAVPPTLTQLGETSSALARREALIFDHAVDPTLPAYEAWFCGRGWPLALNVPCSVGGVARGTLVVCRAREAPYTSGEVALARGVSSQLALALEADRLAQEVREGAVERAVARERERAAEERAAELARANAALRDAASRLAGAHDLDRFLQQTLVAIAREIGAETAMVVTYDPAADAFTQSAFVEHGAPAYPDPGACMPDVATRDQMLFFDRVLDEAAGYAVFDVERDRALFWPGAADYLMGRGLTTAIVLPIRLAGRLLGQIRAAFPAPPTLSAAQRELAEALATQAGLAIEMTRLAHQARAAAVTAAVSGERNALAREVHDTLAQGFSGIVMQLGAARTQLGAAAEGSPALARVERLAREHLAEARRSIAALRPGPDESGATAPARAPTARGLDAELRGAVESARDAHVAASGAAPEVAVAVQGTPRRLPADVQLELLRVAQAALANALRHARARAIRVELAYVPNASTEPAGAPGAAPPAGGVRITVADDGRGFDPDAPHPGRYGLVGMGERAARVGAALTVVTAPGEGTEVVAMWRPTGDA